MNPNYNFHTDSDSSYYEENFIGNNSDMDDMDDMDDMTETEWNQYYPIFDSTSEYLFVNKCLSLMHGPLPAYAYYQSNDEIINFWNDLEDEYFPVIYNYLVENEFIDEVQLNMIESMKNAVIDFVFSYFENRI